MAFYLDKVLTFSWGLRPWKDCSLWVILQWWKRVTWNWKESWGTWCGRSWLIAHWWKPRLTVDVWGMGFVHSVYPYAAGLVLPGRNLLLLPSSAYNELCINKCEIWVKLKLLPTILVLESHKLIAELSVLCGNTVICKGYSACLCST